MNITTRAVEQQWRAIAPILTIQSEQDYDDSVERLNDLIDEVGTDETHPLYTLLDTLGILIESYERSHFPMPESTGADVLCYLMEEHSLSTADLPELGSSEAVDSILEGKQEMSITQVKAVARRFNLSPAAFI